MQKTVHAKPSVPQTLATLAPQTSFPWPEKLERDPECYPWPVHWDKHNRDGRSEPPLGHGQRGGGGRDVSRQIRVRGACRVGHRPTTQYHRAKILPTDTRHLDTPSEEQIIQTPRGVLRGPRPQDCEVWVQQTSKWPLHLAMAPPAILQSPDAAVSLNLLPAGTRTQRAQTEGCGLHRDPGN